MMSFPNAALEQFHRNSALHARPTFSSPHPGKQMPQSNRFCKQCRATLYACTRDTDALTTPDPPNSNEETVSCEHPRQYTETSGSRRTKNENCSL